MKKFFSIVGCSRLELLDMLPRGLRTLEIGVQAGSFSKEILTRVNPTIHHMVDPYQTSTSSEYAYDIANNQDHEKNYRLVLKKFSRQLEEGTVVLHRKSSLDALRDFPDNFFDFIYIDGMHYYDAVLLDLFKYTKKLSKYGILSGHDYANNPDARQQKFGVIEAVQTFTEKTDFSLRLLTWELWPTYILSRDESPIMDTLLASIEKKNMNHITIHESLKGNLFFMGHKILMNVFHHAEP